jgi:hypothetical protein
MGQVTERDGPGAHVRRFDGEAGDIIVGWLVRLLLVLGLILLVAYEAISVGVTYVGLDDDAREVALAARAAYRSGSTESEITELASEQATEVEARLVALDMDDQSLTVTVERDAPTVLLHRFGPTEDLATATVTRTVDTS